MSKDTGADTDTDTRFYRYRAFVFNTTWYIDINGSIFKILIEQMYFVNEGFKLMLNLKKVLNEFGTVNYIRYVRSDRIIRRKVVLQAYSFWFYFR